ncbi:NAD-dependent epimerase/dehydratase family protein [Candidatus Nitrospira nitrificans]|uniref:Putative GDP-L-fucose synthase n=1 Tax=Candidatus Nitrospira nitrificans TaxID=1742973 RepID=A0A0S4L4N2_9BACT|nr:NAD-dependent epimerase/dehydratase family protein [Candidatus Nitrospira nitrificans]CUS31544.1 putative GDP-L-fucose synthase [Candidatus Nitrospira nitrificans]
MTGPLLVTGGSGLLGSAVRELHPQAVFVTSADGDLRRPDVAKALFDEVRPSKILHLAGLVGGVKANAEENSRFFEDNALINLSVLSAARALRIPRLVSILSSCAFPMFSDRATSEEDLQLGFLYDGNAGYGHAKRMLDFHTRLAVKDEGLAWTTVTPVTMYGPHDSFDAEHSHVVGSLIQRCWKAKTTGTQYVVWGSGRAVRQFVFARDVARVALDATERDLDPGTTIIAPDQGITIRSLAETIAAAMDYTGPIHFDRSQPEGMLIKRLQSTCFTSRFPAFQFTALRNGLAETVRWFAQQTSLAETVGATPVCDAHVDRR